MVAQTLLLSIRPRYAEKIFDGTKKVELRRTKPRLALGDVVLVYETLPTKALCGAFKVADLIVDRPSRLWTRIGNLTGVSQQEFRSYYSDAEIAYGICVKYAWRFDKPIPLETLRRIIPKFQPPQVFRYLNKREAWMLQNRATRCRAA